MSLEADNVLLLGSLLAEGDESNDGNGSEGEEADEGLGLVISLSEVSAILDDEVLLN